MSKNGIAGFLSELLFLKSIKSLSNSSVFSIVTEPPLAN